MSSIILHPTGIYSTNYEYSANGAFSDVGEACVRIPLSSIPELDATEAGGSTGDYRKLLWGLLEHNYDHQESLDPAPSNMTVSRSGLTFVDEDSVQRSYNVSFRYSVSGMDVEAES